MNVTAPDSQIDQSVSALEALDTAALVGTLGEVSAISSWLTHLAALATLRQSLKKLMPGSIAGASGPAAVAADLTRNGVGPMLVQLGQSPGRMQALALVSSSISACDPFPAAGIKVGAVRVPSIDPARILATLQPLMGVASLQLPALASLITLSTAMPMLRGVSSLTKVVGPKVPAIGLPPVPAGAPWGAWAGSIAALSGTLGGIRRSGYAGPLDALTAEQLLGRVQSAGARPTPTLPHVETSALGSLVTMLSAIQLARKQLAVDLLKPGWPAALSRVTASAVAAQQQFGAVLPPMPSAQIVGDASALRSTLAGLNRLSALGIPLRSPDAAAQLDAKIRILEEAAASPALIARGQAADQERLLCLWRDLVRLFHSVIGSTARGGARPNPGGKR